MSNSAVVRALHRRIHFNLNSPVFNKCGRSVRDFLAVTGMATVALFIIFFVFVLFIDDSGDMTGIGNCGIADSNDQLLVVGYYQVSLSV